VKKILLDVSPTGVEHYVHISDDELITEEFTPTVVDDAIIDSVSALRGLPQNKASAFRFAGRIPINLYIKWRQEWQARDDAMSWNTFKVNRINEPDFKNLRLDGKKI